MLRCASRGYSVLRCTSRGYSVLRCTSRGYSVLRCTSKRLGIYYTNTRIYKYIYRDIQYKYKNIQVHIQGYTNTNTRIYKYTKTTQTHTCMPANTCRDVYTNTQLLPLLT